MTSNFPSVSTIKRLFAVSGNNCAFPKCPLPLVDEKSGKVTGRICHIKARSAGGARYDDNQTDDERNSFENLMLLCPIHHDVIDSDEDSYTAERLHKINFDHKKAFQNGQEASDEVVGMLTSNSQNAEIISTSTNQSGGQTANRIYNVLQKEESANDWEREIKIKRFNHDLEIFRQSSELLDEDTLEIMCESLMGDDSYRESYRLPISDFIYFSEKISNHYIDDNLNEKYSNLNKSLRHLLGFLALNFFTKPLNNDSDDTRFCLYPDLNIDRGGKGAPGDMIMYENYANKMVKKVEEVREAYKDYRKNIKEILFV